MLQHVASIFNVCLPSPMTGMSVSEKSGRGREKEHARVKVSQSEEHKGWRRNELGGRECGILPARTDQTRLRQNGDTLCAPKNLKRDKRSADKNSLLLLLLKNNQSIVYQSRRSFLFINRRPNERDETREHETAREKATHAKKKRFEPGWTRTCHF